jgi:hypothetical protein
MNMSDKWKQLVDLIVNEDEQKASDLFHEIVIENSREIYENLISQDDLDEVVSQDEVKDFEQDIKADEEGISEEPEGDLEGASDELEAEMDMEPEAPADMEASDEEELEDRVVDLEDNIAELQKEFEELLSKEDGDDSEADDGEEMEAPAEPEMEEAVATEEDAVVETDETEIDEATEDEVVEESKLEKAPDADKADHADNKASPVAKQQKGGMKVSKGTDASKPAPKAQDMGGTTKPDLKKV